MRYAGELEICAAYTTIQKQVGIKHLAMSIPSSFLNIYMSWVNKQCTILHQTQKPHIARPPIPSTIGRDRHQTGHPWSYIKHMCGRHCAYQSPTWVRGKGEGELPSDGATRQHFTCHLTHLIRPSHQLHDHNSITYRTIPASAYQTPHRQ